MNTSLEMEGVQMEEKDKAWYCLLCSTSLAPELGQEGVLLETARSSILPHYETFTSVQMIILLQRCSMSDRAISDILASVLGKNFVATLFFLDVGCGPTPIYVLLYTLHILIQCIN